MPFFSVVIPTRNRADLLVNSALKSVLNQGFEDFEVVICDNASTDNTQELMKSISDPRVRYIHSPKWIPKERFFEFSLNYAQGKFSILFFDDDVLIPDALEECHRILNNFDVDILTFSSAACYYYPNWHEADKRNSLTIPRYSNNVYIRNSQEHLKKVFAARVAFRGTPNVTNSFYKTPFIKGLIKRYGTLFPHGHMGDYNIACYVLANTEHFIYYDNPLVIFGAWYENTSQQLRDLQTTMSEYQEWVAWATENLLADMPVRSYLFSNCRVAALLDMKKRLDLPWTIDWAGYFHDIQEDITRLKKMGIDVAQMQREFDLAVRSQPEGIKKTIRQPQPVDQNLVGKANLKFQGKDYNFGDILSANEFFNHLQEHGTQATAGQHKWQRNLVLLLKLAGKCVRILFGQRGYDLVLRYTQSLARLSLPGDQT
jgi:glycosyltransferase involved in cell wall biosynthesis